MSVIRTCSGVLLAGPSDTLVDEQVDMEIVEGGEDIDVSKWGACVSTFVTGKDDISVTITHHDNSWQGTDPAPDAGQRLFVRGAAVDIKLQPNGTGAGKPQVAMNITPTNIRHVGGGVNGVWQRTVEARVNGAIDDTPQA